MFVVTSNKYFFITTIYHVLFVRGRVRVRIGRRELVITIITSGPEKSKTQDQDSTPRQRFKTQEKNPRLTFANKNSCFPKNSHFQIKIRIFPKNSDFPKNYDFNKENSHLQIKIWIFPKNRIFPNISAKIRVFPKKLAFLRKDRSSHFS